MNNTNVKDFLDICKNELDQINDNITGAVIGDSITPYLTKYAIIRSCGAIETAFKQVIGDFCMKRQKSQVKRFISNKVIESSCNPSFENICRMLSDFDRDWKDKFKNHINTKSNKDELKTSLQSLVDARNDFAHGGNPSSSINDVCKYFSDSFEIIAILDQIIH